VWRGSSENGLSGRERAWEVRSGECGVSELRLTRAVRCTDEYYALVSLAGAMESGFNNWTYMLEDPELELVRKSPKFPGLVGYATVE
jgi:hypothetical protein